MSVLAAGRKMLLIVWMTVRPKIAAPAPMARPAARLPLNTSSIRAIDPFDRIMKMIPRLGDVQRVFRAPHSIGMSVSEQGIQRRGLRRNRLIATLLLAAMAALFISTTLAPQPGFWILLVRATAEAALVGGLADWFAVTALFRQPLGLPIPHTAILPRNKDRIGEGLALFIERNFLSPDILRTKLRSVDPARLVAAWLAMPANADAVARRLVRMLPHVIDAIDDHDFRAFIGES